MHDPKRVVVIGAGGVGGWLLRGLAPMLEYSAPGSFLLVVDGDRFEDKNRERQDFTRMGWKAEVRVAELAPMYPHTIMIPMASWVVEHTDGAADADSDEKFVTAAELLHEGDLVFCVVDNYAARKLVFDAAGHLDDVDVFTGGNSDGYDGSTYHYRRRDGVDLTDPPAEWHDEIRNPPDRNPGEMSCDERSQLDSGTQLLFTNMAVAALIGGLAHHTCFANEGDGEVTEVYFDVSLGRATPFDRRPGEATEAAA